MAAFGAVTSTQEVSVLAGSLIPAANLGTGSADSTKFLRGDQTWATRTREELAAMWDVPVIKTDIGTSFVDIYTQTNADGKSVQIDTNGKTEVRLQVNWNKVGTGTQTVQVLEVGTSDVLISMDVESGRNVSGLTGIPAFAENAVKFYKLQAKSTTALDTPIFEGARIYLK